MDYLWISSTICLKFECESGSEDVADDSVESLASSKLSLERFSVGMVNDIKSASLVFVAVRFGLRCELGGGPIGGANDPLLDDVGNGFGLAYDIDGDGDGELPNEPGRGRVTDDKLLCAEI